MATWAQDSMRRREARAKRGLARAFPRKAKSATAGMSPAKRAAYYTKQAAKNLKLAKAVEKSKTGNVRAAATHRRVAAEYAAKARLAEGRVRSLRRREQGSK